MSDLPPGLKIMSLTHDNLPKDLRDKLEKIIRVNGRLTPDMLSSDDKQRLVKAAMEVTETHGAELFANQLNEASKIVTSQLEAYMELTDELMLPFHVPGTHPACLSLYNACAKYVSTYNAVELDHKHCIKDTPEKESD